MKRITTLFLKMLGGLLIVSLIIVGVGWWRLEQGPVKLGFLHGFVENVVGNSLENADLTIDDAVLVRDEENNALRFRLRGIKIKDDKGNFIARAPALEISLDMSQLMTGSVKLTSLTLIGPRFTVLRKIDGSLKLGFEEEDTESSRRRTTRVKTPSAQDIIQSTKREDQGDVLTTLISTLTNLDEEDSATSRLRNITIRNARISLYDESLDSLFYIPKSSMVFRRGKKGLILLANGQVAGGEAPGRMKLEVIFNENTGIVDVVAIVSDLVPTALSDNMQKVNSVARIGMPLNGKAFFRLNKKGELLNAKAMLDAGAGHVKFPAIMVEPLLVDEGAFRLVYDANQNQLRIDDSVVFVDGVEARLAGVLRSIRDDDGRMKGFSYRLAANSREVKGGRKPEHLVENITFNGNVDLDNSTLNVSQFSLVAGKAKIDLAGAITDGASGTSINLNSSVKNLPISLIKTLWPPAALQGARDWIVEHFKKGNVSEAEIKIALTPEAIKAAENNQPIPQEQINIAFQVNDMSASYFGELPPFYQANGYGLLTGDSFKLQMNSGKAKVPSGKILDLSDGYLEISELHKHGPGSTIKLRIKGSAKAMLEVIDQKPLGYTTQMGIDPNTVSGVGEAMLKLNMPLLKELPVDLVKLDTQVNLKNVKLKDVIGKIDLTGGQLNLKVTTNKLKASGNILLNNAPAYLVWNEDFDLSKKYTTRFSLKSRLTGKTRRLLGIDTSSFMSGPSMVNLEAHGRGQDIQLAKVKVNLDEANLFYEPLGWSQRKQKGTSVIFDLGFPNKDEITINNLRLKGREVLVEGDMRLKDDGRFTSVNLHKIHLGSITKLSVKGARDKQGVLRLVSKASAIDGKAIIDQLDEPAHPQTISRGVNNIVRINASVKTAPTYNQHVLKNINGDITLKAGRLTDLTLNGSFEDRSNLNITVASHEKRRRMIVKGQNAGLLLSAADLYGKIRGGTIIFKSWLAEPNEPSKGTLRIKDFIVSDQVLNKIAHNAPKAEFRPKKGELFFEKLKLPFKRTGSHIKIKNAVLKGQSMGATANGNIDTTAEKIDVVGSIIPAYGLNSLISHVPIVGQIIAGGKGEGVFGINFSIRGKIKNPNFKTDPLSALAPGLLRKLLQGGGDRDDDFEDVDGVFKTN